MAEIVATTSLPVDRLMATDCNATARANIYRVSQKNGSPLCFAISWLPIWQEKLFCTFSNSPACVESKNIDTFILGLELADSQTK